MQIMRGLTEKSIAHADHAIIGGPGTTSGRSAIPPTVTFQALDANVSVFRTSRQDSQHTAQYMQIMRGLTEKSIVHANHAIIGGPGTTSSQSATPTFRALDANVFGISSFALPDKVQSTQLSVRRSMLKR